MKLSEWAKQKGISYRTAHRMFKADNLPIKYEQLPTGTIIVYPDEEILYNKVVLYGRVSSNDQKEDLKRQMRRLKDFASSHGYTIEQEISEIGSGLNGRRRKLNKLLCDSNIKCIIVEHKDRLTRFGFEMLEEALRASNRKIIVINETEYKEDIGQDFVDLITSMCARIYGKRGAKNRATKALKAIENWKEKR